MTFRAAVTAFGVLLIACDNPFAGGSARAYQAVAAGREHTCAVAEDGSAYCWGRGLDGELGIGIKENRGRPARVRGTSVFAQITAGDAHTCALTTDGTAYCWGANTHGQRGDPAGADNAEPVAVATELRFRSISAGGSHTCALTVNSAAYCWGSNSFGQLGNGTLADASTPVAVAGGTSFLQLSSGSDHTCAVTNGGEGYCWGRNHYGQLGNGSAEQSAVPARVSAEVSLKQIGPGTTHTCAVAANAQMYCWGSLIFGEAGIGASYDGIPGEVRPRPVAPQFPSLGMGTFVHAGEYATCAIALDGAGRCWGRGEFGQIGNGRLDQQWYPQPIYLQPLQLHGGDLFTITSLAVSGGTHVCALVEQSVFCWGMGRAGQLGLLGSSYAPLPQRVAD